jgi:hypothetical protein
MHRTWFAPTLPHRRARLRTVVFTNDMPTLRMLTNHDSVASSSSDIEYAATRDFATQPQLMIPQRSALAHVLLCVSGSSTPWHLSTIAFLSRSLDCLLASVSTTARYLGTALNIQFQILCSYSLLPQHLSTTFHWASSLPCHDLTDTLQPNAPSDPSITPRHHRASPHARDAELR